MGTNRHGHPTQPANDRLVGPMSCDVCGPVRRRDPEPVRLVGTAGDVQVCEPCIRILAERAGL